MTTHGYWACSAMSIHTISFVNGGRRRSGLTNMSLLDNTTQIGDNAFGIELVEPKETTSGMAHKVVRADRIASFVIGTQI